MRTTLAFVLAATALNAAQSGWSVYGGDAGGTRYSALKQITRENVAKLKLAWTYHTGALQPQTALNEKAAFEATPILVEDTLYLSTPFNQVIALDPATGVARWTFDPKMDRSHGYSEVSSRGVSAWTDSRAAEGAPCKLRIFEGTIDARLIALDGKTGKPCAGFGSAGTVDLTRGVGYGPEFRGDYQVTSAPAVVGDLAITGSSIGDNGAVDMPRGVVRGYDARTGALRWTWDPIPWAEKQQVRTGAANAWSTIAADPARDLVFIPTGSASPDYFGGARPGDNRWANSVVALKASTGAFVWGFQVAHHDLWDYDVASQPALIEFQGKPAVAVTTKIGNVFVLDRATGKPLHTVEERAVPKSDVAGEEAAASQPLPAWSAMVPQRLTANDVWGATPEAREWCRQKILTLRKRRAVHAAERARLDRFSRQYRWSELGQRRVGSGAEHPRGQHQPRRGHLQGDSARRHAVRLRSRQRNRNFLGRRIRAPARHSLRHAPRVASGAERSAMQCSAVGCARRLRPQQRQTPVGSRTGHDRERLAGGIDQPGRSDGDRRRTDLHGRGAGSAPAGVRQRHRQGDLDRRTSGQRAVHADDL